MSQFGFYFDNKRCTGCKTCVMACRDYYNLPTEIAYRKVYDVEGGQWNHFDDDDHYETSCFTYHLSISCNHCNNPACVEVCPTTAMYKDPDDGIVKIDTQKCIGCGYCAMACPYNAPSVDREAGHAVKCQGCYERLAEGKDPICMAACPLRALTAGDILNLRENHGSIRRIYPMPNAMITGPNITIKPSIAAKLPDVTKSYVSNPEEV